MSISNKRSTVRPVELSQSVASEEMLAVEELSVMQEADVLGMEAREQASKQSAEDEALQVAQVDMPTEYLENPAAAAEVMSDVGEAGLVGEESISRWEAQEVAFAGAGGGSGAGFWGGMGGFGAAAGGIAVGGKLHQNSMDSSDPGGGSVTDATKVVFDLRSGESSTHSGRTFDGAVTYDIYIIIDANDMKADIVGLNAASLDLTWTGGEALGSDDTLHLVTATGSYQADPIWTYGSVSPGTFSSGTTFVTTVSVSRYATSSTTKGEFLWITQTADIWARSSQLIADLTYSSRVGTSHPTTPTPGAMWTGTVTASTSTSNRVVLISATTSFSSIASSMSWNQLSSIPNGLLTTQGLA